MHHKLFAHFLTALAVSALIMLFCLRTTPRLAPSRVGQAAPLADANDTSSVSVGARLSEQPTKARLSETFGQLPLYFIENRGQLDTRVAYYVQGSDKTLYFTPQGITIGLTDRLASQPAAEALMQPAAFRPANLGAERKRENGSQRWVVKVDFIGANPSVKPVGQEQTEAVISYFKGKREQWQAGLKTYATIVYPELWPGIDLVYSGTVNRLKYQFIVKPGADPKRIKLAYRGATRIDLNAAGQLAVSTPVGGFHDDQPYSYQESEGQRVPVETAYALEAKATAGEQVYGFRVGSYDQSQPLVLDPAVLVYCGFIGGSGSDKGLGIAVDGVGNAYVTGSTLSTESSFPVTVGPDLSYNGDGGFGLGPLEPGDAFIAKVKADGTGLVYCGYIGGSGADIGEGIAVDNAGNAYLTGSTNSSEATFPVTVGPGLTFRALGCAGVVCPDAFVAKVNAGGTGLLYCGYIGGTFADWGNGIAVDKVTGEAYVTGTTQSSEGKGFPVAVGPDLTYNDPAGFAYGDAFVAKVKADGTGLLYCGYIGGSVADYGNSIAIDSAGNAYVAGTTRSTETQGFPVAVGPDLTHNGGTDAFVAKVNAEGTALVYCGYIGGVGDDSGDGIAVDSVGNAYVTGQAPSTEATFPVKIGPDLTHNGGYSDAFVAKVKADGTNLLYCGYIGGDNSEWGSSISVDGAGNAYITGGTFSTEATFPVTAGPGLTFNGGQIDAFVAKVKANGTGLIYCGYIGGIWNDRGYGIAVDGAGNAYVTGNTGGLAGTVGPDLTYNGGIDDAFVAKVSFITCTFSIAPTNQTFTAGSAMGSVAVTGPGVCDWTAVSNDSFIMITSGSSGTGNGTVNYSVAANPTANPRSGTLTIAGQTFTVNQSGITCAGLISPTSAAFRALGGADTVMVPAPGDCNWTAASNVPWISITAGTPGTGNGTVSYSVAANTDLTDRTGTMTIASQSFTVTQTGGLMFYPLPSPVRLLETRSNPPSLPGCNKPNAPIAANATFTLPARTACAGLPADAVAVIGNITVIPSGPGYLTLFPSDATQPTVANSNFKAGEVTNNFFTVGLGASGVDAGAFKILTSATTDVIIDLTGYYAPPGAGGLYYHPLPMPVRLVETRPGQSGCFLNGSQKLQGTNDPNTGTPLDVQGRGPGLPAACNAIPNDAAVLVGNATTVFPNAPFGFGYLTIYPSDATRPTVASSNYANNDVINGPFAVKLGADGKFKVYTFSTTHLVVDITGYYSASASDANGMGLLFTSLPKPMRLLETRPDFPSLPLTGCYRPNSPIAGLPNTRTQPVWGMCSDQPITIPATARAVVGNVTVLNPEAGGYLTFYPGDVGTAPTVATSNYPFPVLFGYNRHYYVGLSPVDGSFKMLTQFTSDYIVDVSGYFAP